MHPRRPGLRLRIWLATVAVVTVAGAVAVQASASASPTRPAKTAGPAAHAAARTLVNRPVSVLTPVQTCAQLAALDLTGLPGAPTQIDSATTATAPGGWSYCNVTGTIAPQDQFELQLPLATYTQRYLQTGCGGLCGTLSIAPPPPLTACRSTTVSSPRPPTTKAIPAAAARSARIPSCGPTLATSPSTSWPWWPRP